jgi:hypothetical protein
MFDYPENKMVGDIDRLFVINKTLNNENNKNQS